MSNFDSIHNANLDKYARKVRAYYLEVIKELSQLSVSLSLNKNNEFYFRNYSELNKRVNKLLKTLYSNVYGYTVNAIQTEWDLATEKYNELAYVIFGKQLEELPNQVKAKYLSTNAGARRAFVLRKDNGLHLSQKVWNNTKQFKKELELALELGIGRGKSAQSLATHIKQYLNDPDKLFRRVRDEKGILRLSKAAQLYKPGRGRYRSSYKNALRLTRNEPNFSYQASQQEKQKQQDFVVGMDIQVSPGHSPADDKGGIKCIELQGRYKKDFDWTYKWHVDCKCFSTPIVKSKEEISEDTDLILAGKEPDTPSKRQVKSNPKNYTNYVKDTKFKSRTFERNS
jgi:hypothetical protein